MIRSNLLPERFADASGFGGMADQPALAAHLQHGKQLLQELPKVAQHSDRVLSVLGMNPAAYSLLLAERVHFTL